MKYNSKENQVFAVQWTGDNTEEIRSVIPFAAVNHVKTNPKLGEHLTITTYANQTFIMYKDYYAVIPVKGDTTFFVLSPSVFYEMYASSAPQFQMGKFYKYISNDSWILVICTDPQPYSETSFSGTVVAASANANSPVGSHTALWLKQNFKEEPFRVL